MFESGGKGHPFVSRCGRIYLQVTEIPTFQNEEKFMSDRGSSREWESLMYKPLRDFIYSLRHDGWMAVNSNEKAYSTCWTTVDERVADLRTLMMSCIEVRDATAKVATGFFQGQDKVIVPLDTSSGSYLGKCIH